MKIYLLGLTIGMILLASVGHAQEQLDGVENVYIDSIQWNNLTQEEWDELEEALRLVGVLEAHGRLLEKLPKSQSTGGSLVLGTITTDDVKRAACRFSSTISTAVSVACILVTKNRKPEFCPLVAAIIQDACDSGQ